MIDFFHFPGGGLGTVSLLCHLLTSSLISVWCDNEQQSWKLEGCVCTYNAVYTGRCPRRPESQLLVKQTNVLSRNCFHWEREWGKVEQRGRSSIPKLRFLNQPCIVSWEDKIRSSYPKGFIISDIQDLCSRKFILDGKIKFWPYMSNLRLAMHLSPTPVYFKW